MADSSTTSDKSTTSTTISDIIITGISNICSKAGLNAHNFRLSYKSKKLYWSASCGIIGPVMFNIQYNLLEENLTNGLQMVSTIIAFTDLLTKEENRRFTENIMRAHHECRSPCYFNLTNSSVHGVGELERQSVITYIPIERSNFYGFNTYVTICVNYTFNVETGEYFWVIPDTPEVPVEIRLNHDEMTGTLMTMPDENNLRVPEYDRGTTGGYAPVYLPESVLSSPSTAARVGLERGYSTGIPVSVASQTIEDSLTPYRVVNID